MEAQAKQGGREEGGRK